MDILWEDVELFADLSSEFLLLEAFRVTHDSAEVLQQCWDVRKEQTAADSQRIYPEKRNRDVKCTNNSGSSIIIINTPDGYLICHSSDRVRGSHSRSQSDLIHSPWVHSLEWSASSRLYPSPWSSWWQTRFWRITEQIHCAGHHTQGGPFSA